MAKTKTKTKTKAKPRSASPAEFDGIYVLKLVMYLILGAQWLWLEQANGQRLPIPVGLFIGIAFARHEHFQVDRKIEYAVLLVAMLVGFVSNIGIFVTL